MLLKKKQERLDKEKSEEKKSSGIKKIFLQKEQPDSQKKRAEEDFENKKLLSVLQEAFDLITTIEQIRESSKKQINKIWRS